MSPFVPNYEVIPHWYQQKGEKDLHYQWFEYYLNTVNHYGKRAVAAAYREYRVRNAERGMIENEIPAEIRDFRLEKLRRKIKSVPDGWFEICDRNEWKIRAPEYDIWQSYVESQRFQKEQKQIETTFKDLALELAAKAMEIAKYPTTKQTVVNEAEGQIIIIEPVDWSIRDAAMLGKMALELAQASRLKPHKFDAIAALQVLADEGWVPVSVLRNAQAKTEEMQLEMMQTFRIASGMEPLEVQGEDIPDLYAEIAAGENNGNGSTSTNGKSNDSDSLEEN